jgi:vitamin B12 transporter
MRGTESDHTLVMIDGVSINPGTLGNAALQNIDPRLIERIEIVRGPLSSLYGSAAIGGVINIITRKAARDGVHSHFAAQGGSYQTLNLAAGTRIAEGPLSLALDLSHQRSDGYPANEGGTVDHGHRNDTVNAAVGYTLARHQWELGLFSSRGMSAYDSFGLPADQDFDTRILRAGLTSQLSTHWESRLTLSRMTDRIDQGQANYLGQLDYAHTTRSTLDWQHHYQPGTSHRLTGGLVLEREHTNALSYGALFDERLDHQALYLQDQYRHGAHGAVAALRLTRHDSFGDHLTWNLGYDYQLNESTRLRAGAGTAFRAPSGTDLFGYGSNPDLQPERSRSFELGLDHRLSPYGHLALSAYHTRTRDLIVTNFYDLDGLDQWNDGWLIDDPLNENVARATITGVELGYRYNRRPWRFAAVAEWKEPRNEADDRLLLRRARHAATASLRYRQARWDAGLSVQYTGARADIDAQTYQRISAPAYTLVHATGRWRLARHASLEGRIENLFDRRYQVVDGYDAPGRSLYLGLRVESL